MQVDLVIMMRGISDTYDQKNEQFIENLHTQLDDLIDRTKWGPWARDIEVYFTDMN